MLDIETFSQNSNATILAIAAVEFNLETGDIGDTFYTTVNAESNKGFDSSLTPMEALVFGIKQFKQFKQFKQTT